MPASETFSKQFSLEVLEANFTIAMIGIINFTLSFKTEIQNSTSSSQTYDQISLL